MAQKPDKREKLKKPIVDIGQKKSRGIVSQRRRHLDERLQILHHRAIMIEDELKSIDENRFYRVCIFGSARIKAETKEYHDVFQLARFLAWHGVDVLTGGGPGLMEAGNKGAQLGRAEQKSKSMSYGISIDLPHEPEQNLHLDVKRHHHRFSSRLDDFMRLSNAVIITPGGIGTLLELFFSWQLVQVKHIPPRPMVLLEKSYWQGLLDWIRENTLRRGLISSDDLKFVKLVDTPEEAAEIISEDHKKFCEKKKKRQNQNPRL